MGGTLHLVIFFLWLQEQGRTAIHTDFRGALGDLAVLVPAVLNHR
jgi:hypothetical protein